MGCKFVSLPHPAAMLNVSLSVKYFAYKIFYVSLPPEMGRDILTDLDGRHSGISFILKCGEIWLLATT